MPANATLKAIRTFALALPGVARLRGIIVCLLLRLLIGSRAFVLSVAAISGTLPFALLALSRLLSIGIAVALVALVLSVSAGIAFTLPPLGIIGRHLRFIRTAR